MVLRILPDDAAQNEPRLAEGFNWLGAVKSRNALPAWQHRGYSAWISPVTNETCARALFVGDADVAHAWLFIRPISLGSSRGFEAYGLYTEPAERGKGYAPFLLEVALHECGPLISDREGMTDEAYGLWVKASAPWQCALVDLSGQRVMSGPTLVQFHSGYEARGTRLLLELATTPSEPDWGSRP